MDTKTTTLTIFTTGDRVEIGHRDGSVYTGTVAGADANGLLLKPGYSCWISGVGTFVYRKRKFLPWKAMSGVDIEEER